MNAGDTIAAISSAVGPAARMIVRASGPQVASIVQSLLGNVHETGTENAAFQARLSFGGMCVPAWVYRFRGPRSATGEDVVEFHIPGNPLLARMLLDELIRLGARHADPGEFTARAYFNGRIGLSEAEGIAATIAAQNERELSAARQLRAGELARRLQPQLDALADTLALVEVGIDFSEEDVTFLSSSQIEQRIAAVDSSLSALLSESPRFERLSHESHIALVGRPNAGKSTLLNALAGHERAVVSPIAGTTRDAIWAHVHLVRGTVRVIDVAGLDKTGDLAANEISQMMQEQARRAMDEADLIVRVRDCTDRQPHLDLPRTPDLCVAAKSDLNGSAHPDELLVSAITGQNMNELRRRLDLLAFGQAAPASLLALNARHIQGIEAARQALARIQRGTIPGAEVLALELREAMDALGSILGIVTPDDVLGRIFSTFCIGK